MSDLMDTYMMLCQGDGWKDSRCKLHFHALHLDTYGLGSLAKLCVCVLSMQGFQKVKAKQCKEPR